VFNTDFSNISAISWRTALVVEEAGEPERTIDHGQATDKLYHLWLRVECTLFCNLQCRDIEFYSRSDNHCVFTRSEL